MAINPKVKPLLSEMAQKGWSKRAVGLALGLSMRATYTKFKKANFTWSEMEKMVEILDIEDPGDIFFGIKGGQEWENTSPQNK